MQIKLSGLIFVVSSIIFAVCGLISGSNSWYGVALMCFSVGMLIIINKPSKKASKGGRRIKKENFKHRQSLLSACPEAGFLKKR